MSHRLHSVTAFLLASVLAQGAALAADPNPASATSTAPKPALDLRAPPVEQVIPRADLQSMFADEDSEDQDYVRVEQSHYRAPVPGGLLAIPWALLHPTQAWRIFTPVL